jgi:uncharacterized protein YbaA (DUF1428 family)
MSYVDGFVVPVPKRNLPAYRARARKAGKVWREHGALEYKECVADDVKPGQAGATAPEQDLGGTMDPLAAYPAND